MAGILLPATTAISLLLPPSCRRASVAQACFLPGCTEGHSNPNFPTSASRSWSNGPGRSTVPVARGPALHFCPENFPSPLAAVVGEVREGNLGEGRGAVTPSYHLAPAQATGAEWEGLGPRSHRLIWDQAATNQLCDLGEITSL